MRHIKFRVWDSHEKQMITDDVYFYMSINKDGSINTNNSFGERIPMQFTGLYDKKGKEIYEGDILRTEHTTPLLVVYEDGGFCFYNDLTSGSDRLAQNRCERLEIYGNVHENKNLLNT